MLALSYFAQRNPYSAGRNSIERILTLESNNVIINYYNYN